MLLGLAATDEHWHAPDGRAYATVRVEEGDRAHEETLPVRGKDYRSWLGRRYYQETGKAASVGALQDVLSVLEHEDPRKYLPLSLVYFDDIRDPRCNSWCGELLAINEFNETHLLRKIERDRFLRTRRIMKGAGWIDQMYNFHVLDHPLRRSSNTSRGKIHLANPYLGIGRVHH